MPHRSAFLHAISFVLLAVAVHCAAPSQATAKDDFAARMPANAVIALGIADTKAFWGKADALSITPAIERLINSPANSSDLDYQEFQLQLQKLSSQLGYPASLDEFMGSVFSRLNFYMTPGQVGSPIGSVVVDMGIADMAKATQLVTVVNGKNLEEHEIARVGLAPDAVASFSFETLDLAGQTVSHFVKQTDAFSGKSTEGFYGIVGDRLLFANDQAAFAAAVKGEGPTLAGNRDFSRLAGRLPVAKSDLVGWFDADALLKSGGMGAILGQMPGVAKSNKSAFTAQIVQNNVLAKVVSTADPAQNSSVIKARQLRGLKYIVPQPVAAVVDGKLDADLAYQQMSPMIALMGGMGGSSPLAQIEQGLGLSIEQDIVPALGTEMFFTLNGMGPNPANPLIPLVDMLLGCEVRDGAKMAMVMKKIEAKVEELVQGMMPLSQPGQAATGFQTTKVGEAEVRCLSFGMPGISPGYSLHKGYLIVGLTAESIGQAIQRAGGSSPSVIQGDQYQRLHNVAGTNDLYSFSSLDLGQVATILQPYMPLLAQSMGPVQAQLANQVVSDVLPRMGRVTSLETQENGLFAGYVTVEMR